MTKTVLLTGAAGFAGSHIAEELICSGYEVVALDNLTYAGRLDRLVYLDRSHLRFVFHDIGEPLTDSVLKEIGEVDYIVHNAAESHVIRSVDNPAIFIRSNVIGTMNMLEAARKLEAKLIYVSTDEVFGTAPEEVALTETAPLKPSNPYSATKACGEMLTMAWQRTFEVPTIITRTMNLFGERQHPEKFVPKTLRALLRGEVIDIHTINGKPCRRHWLHVENQANAIRFLLENGKWGESYNIAGEAHEVLDVAAEISKLAKVRLHFCEVDITSLFHGFDFQYAVDDAKIRSLGWKPPLDFETGLKQMVDWTKENRRWLE